MQKLRCPECDEVVKVPDGGRGARCPACHARIGPDEPEEEDRDDDEEDRKPRPRKKRRKKAQSRDSERIRGLIPLVLLGPPGVVCAIAAPFSSWATAIGILAGFLLWVGAFFPLWRIYHRDPELLERLEKADHTTEGVVMMLDSIAMAFYRPRQLGAWVFLHYLGFVLFIEGIILIAVFGKLNEAPPNNQPGQNQPGQQGPAGPSPPVEPKVDDDTLITKALADLDSKKPGADWDALEKLGKVQPTQRRQAEVVRKLTPLVENTQDGITRTQAIRALGVWGTAEDVPTLLLLMEHKDPGTREEAMKAVRRFRDPRAIPALIRMMPDYNEARKALAEIGPAVEKEMLQFLGPKADFQWQGPALDVLKEVGTSVSVPYLQVLANLEDVVRAKPAQEALNAINTRSKK